MEVVVIDMKLEDGCKRCQCCIRQQDTARCMIKNRKISKSVIENDKRAAWCPFKPSQYDPKGEEGSRIVEQILKVSGLVTGLRICSCIMEQPAEKRMHYLKTTLEAMLAGVNYSDCFTIQDIGHRYVSHYWLKKGKRK